MGVTARRFEGSCRLGNPRLTTRGMQGSVAAAGELTLGVVGVGRWGRHWARVCNELQGARLGALCDVEPGRRDDLAPSFLGVPWFESLELMLGRSKLDAVVVATPTSSHASIALGALEAGRHVLVEKPLAATVREAQSVCEHRGGRVMVGHLLRHHPAIRRISAMISAGELGKVTHIVCDRLGARPLGREESAWWALAPHDISVMRAVLGAEPLTIQAASTASSGAEPEDAMTAIINYPGGALGVIRVGGESAAKVRRITVIGERRSVTFSDGHLQAKLAYYDSPMLVGEGGAMSAPTEPVHEEAITGLEPLVLQAQHFVDCLRLGRPFITDVREGLDVVRVLEAGSRSLLLGAAVPVRTLDSARLEGTG